MTTREKMIKWRNDMNVTIKQLSENSGVSQTLLSMVEAGEVTHPIIVEKIRKAYGLTELEAEELMPKHHRKHGGAYEPDKFKPLDDTYISRPIVAQSSIIDTYIKEHQDRMARQHQRRSYY